MGIPASFSKKIIYFEIDDILSIICGLHYWPLAWLADHKKISISFETASSKMVSVNSVIYDHK